MLKSNSLSWIALAAATIVLVSSCEKIKGEGPVVMEDRTVVNFSGLNLAIPGDLYYTESSSFHVDIEGEQNILDEIEAVVVDDALKIKTRKVNVNLRPRKPIIVHVSAPTITRMEVSGSGNIHAEAATHPATLALNIGGSGNIKLSEVNSDFINTATNGSGNITIDRGIASTVGAKISGSGNIDLLNLSAQAGSATISGSGNIKIAASQTLQAKISGSGNIYYKGTPAITVDVHGSGNLVHL